MLDSQILGADVEPFDQSEKDQLDGNASAIKAEKEIAQEEYDLYCQKVQETFKEGSKS